MKRSLAFFLLTALFLSGLGACGGSATPHHESDNRAAIGSDAAPNSPVKPQRTELNIFAAASLTEAFQDIEKAFKSKHPEVAIRFNFAGSQTLLVQIEQGAPADVYASADMTHMEQASEKNLVNPPQIFARNRLAIIVPKENPAKIEKYEDLVKAKRIILGVKDVPIGAYARQSLERADHAISPDFSKKVYQHVVSEEMNVKQIVAKVALGESDAAFVYATDVTGEAANDCIMIGVPDELNFFASYPIAVVKNRQTSRVAQAFIDFLLSPEGQQVMQQHGFLPASTQKAGPLPHGGEHDEAAQ